MKKAIRILILILLGGLIVALLVEVHEMKPKINVTSLSLIHATIPDRWQCISCGGEVVADWDYEEMSSEEYLDSLLRPVSANLHNGKIFHWLDRNNGYVVEATIVDYKVPAVAQMYFYLNDPKGRLRKEFWNFSYAPEDIVPTSWDWNNNEADQFAVRCGDGNQDECTGWFYQARYGQYYTLIYFYQELDYRTFSEVARAINENFITNLIQNGSLTHR
jgi:hypothetical protein